MNLFIWYLCLCAAISVPLQLSTAETALPHHPTTTVPLSQCNPQLVGRLLSSRSHDILTWNFLIYPTGIQN